jgi:exopolysaccharide production protein ExoZ
VVSRETFRVPSFLIKRVFRLYPLWLVMLTTFAVTAWLWRGLQLRESLEFFLYSATLLPTNGFPFYDLGWTMQHEVAFYLITVLTVPLFGVAGLAAFLLASALAVHAIDMPWYLAALSSHHGDFLAGVLAFMMRDKLSRFGSLVPCTAGFLILSDLAERSLYWAFPFAMFLLIVGFANLNPAPSAWWRKPAIRLGDASYSIYLIHPMVFLVASAVVSKFPGAPLWSQEPIRFGCIICIVGLSLLSWRYFESRFIGLGNRVAAAQAGPVVAVTAGA